ncbi:MAG TPA: class I SAM-dependent methyltransferase [Acidimicrobiia bacterium]|nr:class I SAM-dependent methyltransferase [Acidimicrobiia bacterium]
MTRPNCRLCGATLEHVMADLGVSPLANRLILPSELNRPEVFYPLTVYYCSGCHLAQIEEYESPERIFSDYPYLSSVSRSWLEHCDAFANTMIERLHLDDSSLVIEVASNDGGLLRYFVDRGVAVLGVEPAGNVAARAIESSIPTEVAFFGTATAEEITADRKADLLVANNVLAHVPDLNDFVAGLRIGLASDGVLSIEFPHLLRLIEERQFDTIYHEHFSYFSFLAAREALSRHGLTVIDVEHLPTHGGSLRVIAMHEGEEPEGPSVRETLEREVAAGLKDPATYERFNETVRGEKRSIVSHVVGLKEAGNSIAGYGAPAKGNTLLNYCGLSTEVIDYTVDTSPFKQGRYLPGSRIPVLEPGAIDETKPDLIFILPWNLKAEIMTQLGHCREWGARFLVRTPDLKVLT